MSDAKRTRTNGIERGRKLYRDLIGPLSSDGPAQEFARLNDTAVNRASLAHIARQGGERGRAARTRLDEWEAGDSSAA
ncbi:hypothetical protein HUT18_14005 [Streptomyces sp. NA04227]|uniref:hypothetical protein n=1 Tax=Streptomyces sp. NA04227 TaxID=2742136 RepID=UPI001591AFA1|nr:hypothetical protein [Streptomyces sp. NA04227]QKW07336.1 hypothetical protein HUT18_14005 [Streptomyces sp. NA04227]